MLSYKSNHVNRTRDYADMSMPQTLLWQTCSIVNCCKLCSNCFPAILCTRLRKCPRRQRVWGQCSTRVVGLGVDNSRILGHRAPVSRLSQNGTASWASSPRSVAIESEHVWTSRRVSEDLSRPVRSKLALTVTVAIVVVVSLLS